MIKINFKKNIIWILSIFTSLIILLILVVLFYISMIENDFKDKFEVISGFPFPSNGEITRIEGCDPFGASDYYHCGGRFLLNRPIYNVYEEAILKDSSITHYRVDKTIGEWGLYSQSTIYFHYFEE